MNTPIVASPEPRPRLGTVIPLRPPKAEPQVPPLGETADQLLELRALIRQAQDAERRLTAEIVSGLQAAGVPTVHGVSAIALLGERRTVTVDPELLHQAVGAAAFQAMTVTLTVARRLLGADDIAAIAETSTSPVLRVEPFDGKEVA